MKRIGILLVVLCIMMGLVACGGDETASTQVPTASTSVATSTASTTPTPSSAPTQTPAASAEVSEIDAPVPDVLEFVIDSTGKGSNKVANGPAVTTVGNGNATGIDAHTGMQIVSIPKGQEGYYTVSLPSSAYSQLMEGYSLEAYFMIPEFDANLPFGTDGHDVLGCVEWDGGFGITNPEEGVLNFQQRITSWQMIDVQAEYEHGEWVHVVMTYNGKDTVTIYLDGVWENMVLLDYGINELVPGVDFFAIGGNSVPADVAPEMIGCGCGVSVGLCNIYSWELSEDEVADVYAAHVEYLLK
ncbi:MAG: hypothetical protein J6L76_01740 [Clostridia bacterium]|nr:hypothetical protein [Clostridia bacterium]